MTIAQMHLAFKLVYDSVDTQGYPGFEPEEIDFYLNRAIERFVKQRYTGNNTQGLSFEESQKRIDDLRTIVVRNLLTNGNVSASPTFPDAYEYSLPQGGLGDDPKYMFLLSAAPFIDKDDCGNAVSPSRRVKSKQVTHDQLEEWLDDPFHKPNLDEVLILFEGTTIFLITDGTYTVTDFTITYLKYPDVVDILAPTDCNLPDHTHQEIVDIAVKLAVAAVENVQRVQIEGSEIRGTE